MRVQGYPNADRIRQLIERVSMTLDARRPSTRPYRTPNSGVDPETTSSRLSAKNIRTNGVLINQLARQTWRPAPCCFADRRRMRLSNAARVPVSRRLIERMSTMLTDRFLDHALRAIDRRPDRTVQSTPQPTRIYVPFAARHSRFVRHHI